MQHFGAGALVFLQFSKCTPVFLMTLAVKGSIHGLQLVLHHPGIEKPLCSLESKLITLGISVWSHHGPVATLRFFIVIFFIIVLSHHIVKRTEGRERRCTCNDSFRPNFKHISFEIEINRGLVHT